MPKGLGLKEIRIKAGYRSAKSAAVKLGCSRIHLAEIERGAGNPSEKLALAMAEAYSVPPEVILGILAKTRKSYARRLSKSIA